MSRLKEALGDLRAALAQSRRGPTESEDACAFCGWPRSAVPIMLTGPGGAICSVCVEHAFKTVLPGLQAGASAPDPEPALITSIPLASRDGAPPPNRIAEHVRQRAAQVTKLLDQVDGARKALLAEAESLAWAIERYLESASSDKLLLALPFDELSALAQLLQRFAAILSDGQREADEVARS